MKKVLALLLTVCLLLGMMTTVALAADAKSKDIVVLYTNDVHCGVDDNIGYAGLAAYKAEMEAAYDSVALVDLGDAIQGDVIGTLSKGEYLVDIMNHVGYDYGIFGNHEFDYGMEALQKAISDAEYTYLSCNFNYTGTGSPTLSGYKAYEIAEYGDKKVAFVGIATPETFFKSTPTYFQDAAGNYVYSFTSGNDGQDLYDVVQDTVDAAKEAGADYVVALAHLGIEEASAPWRSTDLIANTTGIDVLLDGHSHSTIPGDQVKNKDGKDVLLSSTGTKLEAIGKLVITADGKFTTELVTEYETKDETADAFIKGIQAENEKLVNQVVAKSEIDLSMNRADGTRAVRNRESALGDLCADAYRLVSGADISFVNGGGIRATIEKGDVTYGEIIKVHPYGNAMCVIEATGQQILDALEMGAKNTASKASDGTNAIGESGGFLNVSGLKYTIDTTIGTTVETNDNGEFVAVNGARRIKDVQVLKGGKYVDLDPAGTYTLASHNYMLKSGGDGFVMFKGNKILQDEVMIDNQVLITYIQDNLGGVIPANYAAGEKRITIANSPYPDVADSDWYFDAAVYVTDNKLMNGVGKNFAPNADMSRAMLVTVLYRMAGSPEVEGKVSDTFKDCQDGTWYSASVLWAAENKIVNGTNGNFMPNDAVTREQMVAILYRYAKYMEYDVSAGEDTNILSYKDAEKVAEYAISAMQWACGAGVINGSNGYLLPKNDTTRAQCAQVLMKLDKLAKTLVEAE